MPSTYGIRTGIWVKGKMYEIIDVYGLHHSSVKIDWDKGCRGNS